MLRYNQVLPHPDRDSQHLRYVSDRPPVPPRLELPSSDSRERNATPVRVTISRNQARKAADESKPTDYLVGESHALLAEPYSYRDSRHRLVVPPVDGY